MSDNNHTTSWPELAIGFYDRLTGRGAEIAYDFDEMHIKVPSGVGSNAEHARMDTLRNGPNHDHEKWRVSPKLIVVGRLDGTFAGRPFGLQANLVTSGSMFPVFGPHFRFATALPRPDRSVSWPRSGKIRNSA